MGNSPSHRGHGKLIAESTTSVEKVWIYEHAIIVEWKFGCIAAPTIHRKLIKYTDIKTMKCRIVGFAKLVVGHHYFGRPLRSYKIHLDNLPVDQRKDFDLRDFLVDKGMHFGLNRRRGVIRSKKTILAISMPRAACSADELSISDSFSDISSYSSI